MSDTKNLNTHKFDQDFESLFDFVHTFTRYIK